MPDCVTPEQWAELHVHRDDPIKNLMFAILELSLRDVTGVASPMSGRKRRRKKYKSTASERERTLAKHSQRASARRRDARTWIFDTDADGVFAFASVCGALGVDAEALRERVSGRDRLTSAGVHQLGSFPDGNNRFS